MATTTPRPTNKELQRVRTGNFDRERKLATDAGKPVPAGQRKTN